MAEDIEREYNAVKGNAALFDFSMEGKLIIRGGRRIDFLNGIVSNDVKNLGIDEGVYAAFPDKFGRVLSDCHIHNFGDFLFVNVPFIAKNRILEKLGEEGKLMKCDAEDATMKYALLSIQGPKALALLEEIFNEEIILEELQSAEKTLMIKNNGEKAAEKEQKANHSNEEKDNGETINKENNEKTNNKGNKETANEIKNIKITIIKRKRSGLEGFDLLFEGKHYKEILGIILEKGKQFGMIKSSNEVHEILRLEAGIPLFGVDFDEKTVLPEIGEKAISYTKGCYTGQEVIARLKNIGKGNTAKKLVRLEIGCNEKLSKGTEIKKDDKKIVYITSSAYSPSLEKAVALGFLERGFYDTTGDIRVNEITGRLHST